MVIKMLLFAVCSNLLRGGDLLRVVSLVLLFPISSLFIYIIRQRNS